MRSRRGDERAREGCPWELKRLPSTRRLPVCYCVKNVKMIVLICDSSEVRNGTGSFALL